MTSSDEWLATAAWGEEYWYMTGYYEIRHTVGFEETNLVGNVFYVNYLRWQGRCQEVFLKQKAPNVLRELQLDLQLFTLNAECEFFANVSAFDDLSIRMKIEEITQTQIQFSFDYVKLTENGREQPVGRGYQRIACMRGLHADTVPCRVPEELQRALAPYTEAKSAPGSRTAEPATQRTGV